MLAKNAIDQARIAFRTELTLLIPRTTRVISCLRGARLKAALCLAISLIAPCLLFGETDKEQVKQLQSQAKAVVREGKVLEGQLKFHEARAKYVEAEGIMPTREGSGAVHHVDQAIKDRVHNFMIDAKHRYDEGKYRDAIAALTEAQVLRPGDPLPLFNLGLCYYKLNDREQAIDFLDQSVARFASPKQKKKVQQLRDAIATGTADAPVTGDKDKIQEFNSIVAATDTDLAGEFAAEETGEPPPADNPDSADEPPAKAKSAASVPLAKPVTTAPKPPGKCERLERLKDSAPQVPALFFNLALCAEQDGRVQDMAGYEAKYLQSAPHATDAKQVQLTLDDLQALSKLTDEKGSQLRALYGKALQYESGGRFDKALQQYQRADTVRPNYAPTKYAEARLHEAFGHAGPARQFFTEYKSLSTNDADMAIADAHLTGLDAHLRQYSASVDEARQIIAEVFARATGVDAATSNGRSATSGATRGAHRKVAAVWAEQQFAMASAKLQVAHELFPLAPEVNQLLAYIYPQMNRPLEAKEAFDAVASNGLPVTFYAKLYPRKGLKIPSYVKCELSRGVVRLITIATYDKKTKEYLAPAKPAGADSLGDLIKSSGNESAAKDFDGLTFVVADLQRVETKYRYVLLAGGGKEYWLSPLNLTGITPAQGAPARRFANPYSRLFQSYAGFDGVKFGKESMTTTEKVSLGLEIASVGGSVYSAVTTGSSLLMAAYIFSAALNAANAANGIAQKDFLQQNRFLRPGRMKMILEESVQPAFLDDPQ